MLSYKVMLHKPKLFVRIFGLKLDKFLILVEKMKLIWDKNELLRLNNKNRKRAVGPPQNLKSQTQESHLLQDVNIILTQLVKNLIL